MTASIRDATTTDIPGIQRVARAAWHATYGEFLPESIIEAILADWYATEQLESPIESPDTLYLVAEFDDVVGYASAAPTGDAEAQLYAIYVDPEQRDEGHGTALLDAIVERLEERGIERLRVEVLADNDIGVSFYESRGFDRTDERARELGERSLPEYVYYLAF